MKALMSVARHAVNELGNTQHLPYVVAEVFDARREQVAEHTLST